MVYRARLTIVNWACNDFFDWEGQFLSKFTHPRACWFELWQGLRGVMPSPKNHRSNASARVGPEREWSGLSKGVWCAAHRRPVGTHTFLQPLGTRLEQDCQGRASGLEILGLALAWLSPKTNPTALAPEKRGLVKTTSGALCSCVEGSPPWPEGVHSAHHT